MKQRLYVNLNENELKVLCDLRDESALKSYKEAILSACDSELIRRLSYIILTEKELRKIAVNLHQIIRKFEQVNIPHDCLYKASNFLDSTIDLIVKEVSCLHVLDFITDSERREIVIRMSSEEKECLSEIKRILRFRNYRTLILTLCVYTSQRIAKPDISLEYPDLKNLGLMMNKTAKLLNSGYEPDFKNFNSLIEEFVQTLVNISVKIKEVNKDVA